MKPVLALVLVVLLLSFCQCTRNANPLLGRYELVAHDNSGQLVFTGTMTLQSHDQNHLKGQCTIKTQQNAPEGLFEKDGGCEGLLDGKSIEMDLAPFMDDAGLLLEGQFNDGVISGVWKLDGFVTSPPLGRFEAVKKL